MRECGTPRKVGDFRHSQAGNAVPAARLRFLCRPYFDFALQAYRRARVPSDVMCAPPAGRVLDIGPAFVKVLGKTVRPFGEPFNPFLLVVLFGMQDPAVSAAKPFPSRQRSLPRHIPS